ncbi:MAG: LUD domain-containing protein [Nitriliruptoraceae bacterium]
MSPATTRSDPDADGAQRALLRTKVEAAASTYHEVAGWEEVAEHAAAHGDRVAIAPSLHAARPSLATSLEERGCTVVVPGTEDPAADVADVPVAIVAGVMAIAETGSVLVAEHELRDRVVTMLCQRLLQVVAADAVVDRLEDAAAWLAPRGGQAGFASLMTGPSRTADIERSLTIGVQGPDEVDVLVLTGTDAATEESTS